MSMQAIDVSPEVYAVFNELKNLKTYVYMTVKLDGNAAVVDQKIKLAEANEDPWGHLVASLSNQQPRFIVFDVFGTEVNGQPSNCLVFIFWCPSSASSMVKMIYAAAKDQVVKSLKGIAYQMQMEEVPTGPCVLDPISISHFAAFYGKPVQKTATGYEYI